MFGASFLAPQPPNGAGQPDRAIKLMEYGIAHNPDNWKLYYDLGFVYYTEVHDYKKASETFERGSRIPNAHPFMKILAARMGRLPVSIEELTTAEHLAGVPTDPDGNAYQLSPEGRILLEKPDDFPFVTKGLPPGYKPPPPQFHNNG